MAAELLASLDDAAHDDTAEIEAAWATEIKARACRVISGESAGEAWPEVRARILGRLNQR